MGNTIYETVELTAVNCGVCGATYAINERYRLKKKENGGGWHCPYCQTSWGYFGKTDFQLEREKRELLEQQLHRERASHDQTRADRDAAKRREAAQKAAKTRIKNRVGKGVCPFCNRTFQNLQRHMQSQHPGFAGDES